MCGLEFLSRLPRVLQCCAFIIVSYYYYYYLCLWRYCSLYGRRRLLLLIDVDQTMKKIPVENKENSTAFPRRSRSTTRLLGDSEEPFTKRNSKSIRVQTPRAPRCPILAEESPLSAVNAAVNVSPALGSAPPALPGRDLATPSCNGCTCCS